MSSDESDESDEEDKRPEDPELYVDNTCETIEVTKDFVKLSEELHTEFLKIKEHYKETIVASLKEHLDQLNATKPT